LCIGSNLETYKWKPPEASDSSPLADEREPLGIQIGEAA
jgi:hypothetical protein